LGLERKKKRRNEKAQLQQVFPSICHQTIMYTGGTIAGGEKREKKKKKRKKKKGRQYAFHILTFLI